MKQRAASRPRLRISGPPVRSTEFPALAESFLVAGVVAFLGLRAVLTLTGFPRVGGGELHIAHMLWGGALMVAAVLLLVAYVDRRVDHAAVVIAGLGFGVFIDEIGKFVTSDNDYFFRPAIALIYVAFVLVFLAAHELAGAKPLTQREQLANALDLLAGSVGGPLDEDDAARIDRLVVGGSEGTLESELRALIQRLPRGEEGPTVVEQVARWARAVYGRVIASSRFEAGVTVAVAIYAGAAIVSGVALLASMLQAAGLVPGLAQLPAAAPAPDELAAAASSFAGALLVIRGVLLLPTDRARAYTWFSRGLRVWILVTQVFIFYASQLAGITGLALDVIAYATVRFALGRERALGRNRPLRSERAVGGNRSPGARGGVTARAAGETEHDATSTVVPAREA